MNTLQEEKPPGPPRLPGDIKNAELVSRLLAATPPYLFGAMPLQPHAYFFSEMLRSFVQVRHATRVAPQLRRAKKRPFKYFAGDEPSKPEWQHYQPWLDKVEPSPETKEETPDKEKSDVPLELTVDKSRPPSRTESPKIDVETEKKSTPFLEVENDSSQPNLILPPPPPMWYPPIYNPQFGGVDPLNFFIDLRVSGHIYDRKLRDLPRPRHFSAFSVPQRVDSTLESRRPVRRDLGTPYVMRNLKNIYDNVRLNREEIKSDSEK